MRKHNSDQRLDAEEKAVLHAYEAGTSKRLPIPKNIAAMAAETLKKNKNINIRISENDLNSIKLKAAREGLPYQTLIGSVLHKYASGYL